MNLGKRKIIALVSGCAIVVAGVSYTTVAHAATSCSVVYAGNSWNEGGGGGGFSANITLRNTGDAWTTWTLQFTLPSGQTYTQGWSANWTASGTNLTATPLDWNRSIPNGGSTGIGFNGRWTGTFSTPTSFRVNGVTCGGTPPTSPPPTTGPPPTTPPPTSPPPTSPPPSGGPRADNPYANAGVYVNPQWRTRANAEPGGSRIANQPTGVWFDRISALTGNGSPTTGTMGLINHLDEAVRQDAANGSAPLVLQIVVYNLPGRDCAALASNGELGATELPRYKTDYIDVMYGMINRAAYRNLRIVAIIEIDSIPNLVTNVGSRPTATPQCDTMLANGNYIKGVGYALAKLGSIPNVYNYIDAGHHGWIGWADNFGATATKLREAAGAEGATPAVVHGFITNTANTSALQEPYININGSIGGQQVKQSAWVDWNQYNDELSFAQAFRQQLVSAGFNSSIGMLIDTSRNGWGNCVRGPCPALTTRPTGPSSSTDLNTNINQSRIDRRIHKGNWCNQAGAGLGERPRANPASGIDAYVWIKPPGESDGSSREIPNNEGKGFDRMCDPTYTGNPRNGNSMSGALPDAPLSGHWFSAQFQQLMANAYPPL